MLGVRVPVVGFGFWRWWTVCYDEYNYFGTNVFQYTKINELIAGTSIDTENQAADSYQWLYDSVYLLHLGVNVWDSIQAWNGHENNWANFDFSFNVSQGLARTLMFADKVFSA